MLTLRNIRGKKANKIRWDALKLLDWEKDAKEIEFIAQVSNPLFFSKRTPDAVVEKAREEIESEWQLKQYAEKVSK